MTKVATEKLAYSGEEISIMANYGKHGSIECPFCGQYLRVYWWSLAGSGKKCFCGATAGYLFGQLSFTKEPEVKS